jgi:hypothetical protein
MQVGDQDLELAREAALHDLGLGGAELVEIATLDAREVAVDPLELVTRPGFDENPVEHVQGVVAGGAGDWPGA